MGFHVALAHQAKREWESVLLYIVLLISIRAAKTTYGRSKASTLERGGGGCSGRQQSLLLAQQSAPALAKVALGTAEFIGDKCRATVTRSTAMEAHVEHTHSN